MSASAKRATIYLPEEIHKALRLKAAALDRSISDLVSDAVRHSLSEDADDLALLKKRVREPSVDFASVVESLRRRGKL